MISKFYGEQHTRHKGTLSWPGVNGLPLRGPTCPVDDMAQHRSPLLHEWEKQQAATNADSYQETFDLSDPEQREYHGWVKERVLNGWFVKAHEERHWDPETHKMFVYMEWAQLYAEMPLQGPRLGGDFRGGDFSLH
jgi:hypothetical protein